MTSTRPHAGTAAVGLLLLALGGCADQLVEVSTTRADADVVALEAPGRCPAGTVLLSDDDPASGSGAVPSGFEGVAVLRCDVDHSSMTVEAGVERYTVRQWQRPLTAELGAGLALPDRVFRRGGTACAVSSGGTTALYVVDDRGRAVRVLPPTDEPCNVIRADVEPLLPDADSSPDTTFSAEQPAR